MLKTTILELIIKIFFRDLSNFNVKREIIKGFILLNRSLLKVYNLVNKTRKIKSII